MNAAITSRIAPPDAVEAVAARTETEFFNTAGAIADLPADLWRILPDGFDALLVLAGPAVMIAATVILTFALARRALRRLRGKTDTERNAFVGMLKLTGLEFLALAAAVLVSRVLLVRVFVIPPGAESLASDLTAAVVRWLFGITLAIILFQPSAPRFRLAPVDDGDARKAVWHIAIVLAVGYLHIALLDAAKRCGLPIVSAKLISCLVGLGMAAGTVQLLMVLRRKGMPRVLRLMAIWLTLATCLLWLWGWIALDFELYRGAVATIGALLVALALDRAVALGIRDSQKPTIMRMLSVLRVIVAAAAAALILRIVVDVWMTGAFGWLSPQEWRAISRRLTVVSAMMVFAAALAAIVHAATEAWLAPEPGATTEQREAQLARLSTTLPIIRLVAMVLIGVVFSLLALSALGVDVTALMVGAGIVGLAISFGLQTLVKDIVAGLFVRIDDAFRMGETIEFGGKRCQLERINLRSVRLRDEDGRLHTIPFGELGIVTNHSRRLVRMTALMTLKAIPAKSELVRLSRDAAAALRGEPMISHAIIGSIGVRLNEVPDASPSTLALSFTMAALAADRTRSLVQRLFEETVEVAGIEALSPSVSVTLSDLSSPAQPEMASELTL
jgi:small-conductance mechanosensitive channel